MRRWWLFVCRVGRGRSDLSGGLSDIEPMQLGPQHTFRCPNRGIRHRAECNCPVRVGLSWGFANATHLSVHKLPSGPAEWCVTFTWPNHAGGQAVPHSELREKACDVRTRDTRQDRHNQPLTRNINHSSALEVPITSSAAG